MDLYQKHTLDNGIVVLTEQIPHVRSVSVGVWVGVGSRDESDEVMGISHFIEHMMFKGTERKTAKNIAETLDAVGGQLNAFTTKEYTCYYSRVLDEFFDLAVDLLGDMLLNSLFAAADIDRERNVILEEIKMYEDTPDELVHDIFAHTVWQGHVLGRPIIGSENVIKHMSREDILNFYRTHYTPSQMVISVAGNIEHNRVVEKLGGVFGKYQGESKPRPMTVPVPYREVACRAKETEQVHLCIGTQGLPLGHDRVYTVQLFNTILGGGLSSRLFQEVREQRGLVYSIFSYHSSYHDTGLFCIYTGLSKENVAPALELVFKEIRDIQLNSVTGVELQRAKDQLKGNLLLSLENVSTRMSRLGKSQLYLGKVIHPDEIVARINRVTVEEVQDLAQTMIRPEKFALASVGPWQDCGTLDNLLKSLGE